MEPNLSYEELSAMGRHAFSIKDLEALLDELSKKPGSRKLTWDTVIRMLDQENFHVLVCIDGGAKSLDGRSARIVGMATIDFRMFLSGGKGRIEDVVVLESYRGRGIGKELVLGLIAIAKKRGAHQVGWGIWNFPIEKIDLTSRRTADRAAAHKLYESLVLSLRETDVFRFRLGDCE